MSDFIYVKWLHQNQLGNVKKWRYISKWLTFCGRRQEEGTEMKFKANPTFIDLFCFLKNAGYSFNSLNI